jgi:hypothetical protein
MTERYEWDYPPTMRPRRGRRPRIETVEILPPRQPEPERHIRVTVTAHRRQRQHVPPWLIVLLIIATLMWMAPLGTIILIAIVSIFIAEHPTIAFVIGGTIALVAIAALRERWHGRTF